MDRNSAILLYEWLLRSKFRTTDPNKATIFWVPVAPMGVVSHGVPLLALDWARKTMPFYNRSQGADHVIVFPWDSVRTLNQHPLFPPAGRCVCAPRRPASRGRTKPPRSAPRRGAAGSRATR